MEVKDFLISENIKIIEAIQKLDVLGKKTLFLVREDRLVATLTDGDVRRWLLKGGKLEEKVSEIANYQPKYVLEDNRREAFRKLKDHGIEAIPILNEQGKIISIILWNHQEIRLKTGLKLPTVIMAGGFGTRLFPYTKILPKPLIPIGEIPIAEHIMNRFHSFGVDDFYLIVNHKKNMIKAYFNEETRDYRIHYADEEKPLGTGGGIGLLKGKINTTFLLSNCDILIEADYHDIYEYHKKAGNIITMVCAKQKVKIPYGVIETDESGNIMAMKEKPEIDFLTNTGFYVAEPKVIEELEPETAISFPEIIEKYRKSGERVGIYSIKENQWMDMGEVEEMEKMLTGLEISE